MKLLTGLFRAARKRVMTHDNDMGMFRDKLNELVEQKETLSDEDVVKRVDELKEMTIDLPDEEDKAKLDRFLEDFKSVKEQDDAAAKEAASMVADLFEKLDTAAMKDVPAVEETETEESVEEEATDEDGTVGEYVKKNVEEDIDHLNGKDGAEEEAEESVEETVAPEGDAEDAENGPLSEYTLEEIYQYVKRREAEDAGEATDGCADSAEEVEEEEDEEKEEVVTDNAPRIPVTMNGTTAAKGSLADMFKSIKGGR